MWVLIVFILYLLVLAAIGVYCARLNRSLADFVLGGRRLGVWVTAFSAQASDMSAWLLIALPGAAYMNGLSALWIAVGCAVGTAFNWMIVAPRLRRSAGATDALTIPDFLAARYGGGSWPVVRVFAVVAILVAYASYIAAQFIAAGTTFETTFRNVATPWGALTINYHTGMFLGVGIIVLYTAMGGFTAVSWTDVLQGILMVTTVVVLPIVGLIGLGSLPALWGKLHAADPNFLGLRGAGGKTGLSFIMGVCVGNLSWGLGYPGQPHILVRFMALRNPRAMRRAAFLGITWVVLAMWGAIFVGLVARATLETPLTELTKDRAMPLLALKLMHPALAGVMIAAAVAAMMSTVDSQLLVAASAVEKDLCISLYSRLSGKRPADRLAVWFGRITVLVLGAVAIPLAWRQESVLKRVFHPWSILGASLGPVVILGLVSKRANRWGAGVAILVGFVVTAFWKQVSFLFGGKAYFENGLVPGFVLSLVLGYLVSLAAGRFERSEAISGASAA